MRRSGSSARAALAALAIAIVTAVAPAGAQEERRGRALEERLMAPCCWTQTLDAHDSPEARALRDEIDHRLAGGEPVSAIEGDLVARYGERIRAVPRAGFLDAIGLGVLGVLAASAIGLVALGRRWVRRAAAPAPDPEADTDAAPIDAEASAALDATLQAELDSFSEA